MGGAKGGGGGGVAVAPMILPVCLFYFLLVSWEVGHYEQVYPYPMRHRNISHPKANTLVPPCNTRSTYAIIYPY